MRTAKILPVFALIAGIVLATSVPALAQDNWTNGALNNSWNTAGNWSTGAVPTAATTAQIGSNFNVNGNALCRLSAPSNANNVIFGVFTSTFDLNGQSLTITAAGGFNPQTNQTFTLSGAGGTIVGDVQVDTISGCRINASSNITITGNYNVNVSHTLAPSAGVTVTINGNLNVNAPLTLAGAGNIIVVGNVTGAGSITFAPATTPNLHCQGTWTNNGPFSAGVGTITYDGAAAQTIGVGSLVYNNLALSGSGVKSLPAATTVNGICTVVSTLDLNNQTLTLGPASTLTGAGTIQFTGGGTLNIGNLFTATGAFTAGTGTVVYNGSAAQTVRALNGANGYNILTIGGSGIKSLASGLTEVNGAFTINSTLNLNGATLSPIVGTIGGNGTISNTTGTGSIVIPAAGLTTTGSMTLTATAPIQTIGAGNTWTLTGPLTVNGTANVTLAGPMIANNTLTLGGTGTFSVAGALSGTGAVSFSAAGKLDVTAGLTTTGSFTPGTGTVEYVGAAAQNVSAHTYFGLTIGGSAPCTLLGATTVNGTCTVNSTLAMNNQTLTMGSASTLTGAGSITFAGTDTLNIGNVWNGTGPLNMTLGGTVVYNGSAAQTVRAATGANAYNSLVIAGSGTKSLAVGGAQVTATPVASLTVTSNLNLAGQDLNLGAVGTINAGTGTISNSTGTGEIDGTVTDNATLTMSATAPILITGAWTVANPLTINGASNVSFTAAAGLTTNANLTLSGTGIVAVTGTLSGTGNVTFTAAQTLNLSGNPNAYTATGVFTPGTGTVGYVFAGAQNVALLTYNGLNLGGSGVKSLQAGTTTVNGTCTVSATLDIAANTLTMGGASTLTGAGTIQFTGGGTLNIGNVYSATGPFTAATGTVVYNGAAAQTVRAQTGVNAYNNLTIAGSGTKSLAAGTATVTGTLTVTSTLNLNGQTLDPELAGVGSINGTGIITNSTGTGTILGATMTVNGNPTINAAFPITTAAASNWTIAGGAVLTVNGSSTLTFGSGASVFTVTGTLNLSGTGTMTANGTGGLTGAGAVNFTSTETLNTVGVFTPTTFTPGTGTVGYTGAAQNINPLTYNNLTAGGSNTKTLAGATTVGSTLTVNSTLDLAAQTLTMGSGTIAGIGTIEEVAAGTGTITGTITMTGSITLDPQANTLSFPGSWTTSGTLTIIGLGASNLNFGTNLTANNTLTFAGTGTTTITGNLAGSGLITFTAAETLNLNGNFTATGSFSAGAGTVVYNGAAAQTVRGLSGVNAYGNLTIGGAGGVKAMAGATSVTGTFNINTTLNLNGNTLTVISGTINGNGTLQNTTGTGTVAQSVAVAGTLTLNAAALISCTGPWTINAGQSLTVTGASNVTFTSTLTATGALNLSGTGTVTMQTDLTGTGAVTFTTAQTLAIQSAFSNTGAFTAGTGTVTYNGTIPQNVRSLTGANAYFNLVIGGTGIKTLAGNVDETGTCTVSSTLNISARTLGILGSGNLVVSGAGAINNNGAVFHINP